MTRRARRRRSPSPARGRARKRAQSLESLTASALIDRMLAKLEQIDALIESFEMRRRKYEELDARPRGAWLH